jgi:flagellar biosynthesis/type III secretory pathway chaperone
MPRPNFNTAALRRILQQQLGVGKELLALAGTMEQALIAGDVAALEALQPKQRKLLEEQTAQETARQQVTLGVSYALGMDRVPTLAAILSALPPAEAMALETLRRRILETEQEMEIVNTRNGRLLENALDFTKFSLDLLTSAALKPARYGTNLAHLAAPSFYIDSKA